MPVFFNESSCRVGTKKGILLMKELNWHSRLKQQHNPDALYFRLQLTHYNSTIYYSISGFKFQYFKKNYRKEFHI